MKFTEELKQKHQDIVALRFASAEAILSADQIARINTFVTQYCEHAKQFKIVINAAQIILNPSKPVSREQLQNVFTVFDYVCYLDIYLSKDIPDQAFFLHPINPEFRSNPIVKRDLVLKIQSYLNKILDRLATQAQAQAQPQAQAQAQAQDSRRSANLSLFDEASSISRTLTFDPSSIDDLITNALIKLMLISFTMNLIDENICEIDSSIFAALERDRAGLLQLLTEISAPLLPPASTSSIFHTCFNNPYYGLGVTGYEQLRTKALEVVSDLNFLILEHSLLTNPEESAFSAMSDSRGVDDSPIIVPKPAPVEVPIPRPRTPVDKINTAANALLEHSPITFSSPGSDASDVPTPLYCVGGAGVQWTPPRRGIDTSYLNTSTPDTGCSRHHLLYTPAGSTDLSLATPGTGDRDMIGSSMSSPADVFGEVRKGLPYSKQSREPVSRLNLDASIEVNPADLSGAVNPCDLSGIADPADVSATIAGHSADAAADPRMNGHRL